MAEAPPILVRWSGDGFAPANATMQKRCDQWYVVGEVYRIEFIEGASDKSRRHYHASIASAWKNLPEAESERFPTPEHLRKWCLIKAGFCEERTLPYENEESAARTAALARSLDGYAVILHRGNVVRIYTAKSQSKRAMPEKGEFQRSKQAVLNIVADMIGVEPHTLAANAQDDEPEQPNEIPAADRTVQRTDNSPPVQPRTIQAAPTTAPSASPGGLSTADASRETEGVERAGQTESADGTDRVFLPRTYAEYLYHLKAWLSFTEDAERIRARMLEERRNIWPTLTPELTVGQIKTLQSLADEALRGI